MQGETPEETYALSFDSVDELAVAYSEQITRGCLFLPTTHMMPLGTVVQVRVHPPNDRPPITTLARVDNVLAPENAYRLRRQPGMGLELFEPHASEFAQSIAECLVGGDDEDAGSSSESSVATILVVDDDHHYRDSVSAMLEGAGYEVTTAKDGLDGLGRAVGSPPDLVLTDVQMPGMNGWQLLRMLRARPALKSTGIIFLTELKSDQERLRAYKLGVDDFLSKPIGEDELNFRVGRVLRSTAVAPHEEGGETLRGDLSTVALASVLSLVEMEKRTGVLTVVSEQGVAELHIEQGNVIHVDIDQDDPPPAGLERLRRVLNWGAGRFELVATEVSATKTIEVPTSYALLECARVTDENNM